LRVLSAGEFREGEVKSQARFGTLVLIEVILQESIPASASAARQAETMAWASNGC
jgi:hypothetical protein